MCLFLGSSELAYPPPPPHLNRKITGSVWQKKNIMPFVINTSKQ